jgi:hypothetical protein
LILSSTPNLPFIQKIHHRPPSSISYLVNCIQQFLSNQQSIPCSRAKIFSISISISFHLTLFHFLSCPFLTFDQMP